MCNYNTNSTKLKGILVSPCPSVHQSVRLSVCGQNRVCSVSSTILNGSISYLHILSSNFRRCVANKFIFGAYGYCHHLCLCVCLSVCQLLAVRAITHHPFKLGSPNLDQKLQNISLKVPIVLGLIQLNLTGQIYLNFKALFICIAFASLKYLPLNKHQAIICTSDGLF